MYKNLYVGNPSNYRKLTTNLSKLNLPILIFATLTVIISSCGEKPGEPDTTPPTVVITRPVDGDTLVSPINIKTVAIDNDAVKEVEFFVDGWSLGKDDSDPYEKYWDVSYWSDGNIHNILAKGSDKSGNIGESDLVTVIVSENAISPPIQLTPEDSGLVTDTDTPTLLWHSLRNAVSYYVVVSLMPDFSEIEYSATVSDTITTTKPLSHYDRHYWKLRGQNEVGRYSEWSDVRSFWIVGPEAPTLISPYDREVILDTTTITFVWNSSPNAVEYNLKVYPDYLDSLADTTAEITGLGYGWHQWRVQGKNDVGLWGDWSKSREFHAGNIPGWTFGSTYNDHGYSVEQTSDGGYIVAGSYGAQYRVDYVWLIKADANGSEQWSQTFDRGVGECVHQTADGGYIITGSTGSYAYPGDVSLIKTDASGQIEWQQTYGGNSADIGYSVQQTSDGGYIITGYTKSYGAGRSDVWLIKTDASGLEQWTKTFGGSQDDLGYSVQQTNDSGYVIVGSTASYGAGGYDVWLIKTDANGVEQWNNTLGDISSDAGYSAQETEDGGYIITGVTSSDAWIIKTDSNGLEEWNRTFNGSAFSVGRSVQSTQDGGYIIAGYIRSYGSRYTDVYLTKTDANGSTEWTRTFGDVKTSDFGYSVQQTKDGGYIIVGSTGSYGAGGYDVWLIKTDSQGDVVY